MTDAALRSAVRAALSAVDRAASAASRVHAWARGSPVRWMVALAGAVLAALAVRRVVVV